MHSPKCASVFVKNGMKRRNLEGETFGRWKVIRIGRIDKLKVGHVLTYWWCKCSCGTEKEVLGWSLTRGISNSCGCLHSKTFEKHGMTKTTEYSSWNGMRNRCNNKNDRRFKDYGGRGIKVCEEWKNSFVAFYRDMGKKPVGTSLDRIDVNGNYEPSNCRWATAKEQQNNTRSNVLIEYKGKKDTVPNWASTLKIKDCTLRTRVRRGWMAEKALETPVQKRSLK